MDVFKIKAIRFIINFLVTLTILLTTTYYLYSKEPILFALKDTMVPMKGVIIIVIIYSFIIAAIFEIITILLMRKIRR